MLTLTNLDPWVKDKDGLIPRIIALQQGHSLIVGALEQAEKLCRKHIFQDFLFIDM